MQNCKLAKSLQHSPDILAWQLEESQKHCPFWDSNFFLRRTIRKLVFRLGDSLICMNLQHRGLSCSLELLLRQYRPNVNPSSLLDTYACFAMTFDYLLMRFVEFAESQIPMTQILEYLDDEDNEPISQSRYRARIHDDNSKIPANGIYTGDLLKTPEYAQENSHTRRIYQEMDRRDKKEAFLRQRAEARQAQRLRVKSRLLTMWIAQCACCNKHSLHSTSGYIIRGHCFHRE